MYKFKITIYTNLIIIITRHLNLNYIHTSNYTSMIILFVDHSRDVLEELDRVIRLDARVLRIDDGLDVLNLGNF